MTTQIPRPAQRAGPAVHRTIGALIRRTRTERGMTLAELGALTGYSAAQVSRYERGICPLTDVTTLRAFADALDLPHQLLGVTPTTPPGRRHSRGTHATGPNLALPGPTVAMTSTAPAPPDAAGQSTQSWNDMDDGGPVRRRELLASLAATAAAAAGAPRSSQPTPIPPHDAATALVAGIRDAMLGLSPPPRILGPTDPGQHHTDLTRALADFNHSRLADLAVRLPALIDTGHSLTAERPEAHRAFLAHSYLLAARVLIKLDEDQLGWLAVDRARHLAAHTDDPMLAAETSRQLAVLARRSGWHDQALAIAVTAADHPALHTDTPTLTAVRGLLIQSAAYSAAKRGDAATMRELTNEAHHLAERLRGPSVLPAYGGFTPATVQLQRISAENSLGEPAAALAAAHSFDPAALPTTERRARYWTDFAAALAHTGRRSDCLHALLTAERLAPEETRARPAVRNLVTGLLVSGRTTGELHGLAARTSTLNR